MLLIRCPYCRQDLPELEFRHAGEAHVARPTNLSTISEDEFEAFFFIRSNPKGIAYERWRHVHGCGRFFNAARDTVTDRFAITYKAGEPRPVLPAIGDTGPAAWSNVEPKKLNAKPASRSEGK